MPTAQFSAPILPPAGQWFDNNGDPLNGGKVFVYEAGTTTPDTSYPTYADGLAGTNANANPVVLDANGRAQIWLQAGRLYKIVVKDSTEATTYQTVDSYSPAQGYPQPYPSEWVPQLTGTIAYSSSTQFTITTTTDLRPIFHAGRRVKVTCTGGTFYGSVVTSSFSSPTNTITVVLEAGNVLDSGLSAVWYGWTSSTAQASSPSSVMDRPTNVYAYRDSTDQTIGGSGWVKVALNAEVVDSLGEFDAVTNNRWTPYMQGGMGYGQRYLMVGQVTLVGSITSCQIAIYRDGAAIATRRENSGIAGGTIDITFVETQQSGSGHYYELWVNPSGAVDLDAGAGATFLQVTRL